MQCHGMPNVAQPSCTQPLYSIFSIQCCLCRRLPMFRSFTCCKAFMDEYKAMRPFSPRLPLVVIVSVT
jgi:hypothetical protein